MSEFFFVLTTIFVAYVIYTLIGEKKAMTKSKAIEIKTETQLVAEQPKPEVAVAKEKPAEIKPETVKTVNVEATVADVSEPKIAATKTTKSKPAATKKTTVTAIKSVGLKDPKTGEIATAYSNYRFTKRWIKDALVAEGLLEKVYVANELNAETDAKIKEAIGKLEAIDKYKV
jgi:hypothetical protein